MKLMTVITALVATLAVTVGAAAAPAAKSPLSLTLRPADVPGAKGTRGPAPASLLQGLRGVGVRAMGAYYEYDWVTGPAKGKSVSGLVLVTANAAQARKLFMLFRTEMLREAGARAVRVPAYGQQQVATLGRAVQEPDLLVRTNTVVWQLSVRSQGVQTLTPAQALVELRTYAAKQKRRVGRG